MLIIIWGDPEKLNNIQEKLHNLQGPAQNKNAGPLVQKLLRMSEWKTAQHEIKGETL